MKVFYSPDFVGSAYAFETTRKAQWIASSLERSPIEGLRLVAPRALSYEEVVRIHDPAYVEAVRTGNPRDLAESQGFVWDPGLWPMVLASNGGAVAAALDALTDGISGSLSSGLHHARYGSGAGFCTFNGLVLAAREALAAGAESILILDLDAHCGGGTASLIASDPRIWQLDVSMDSFDYYGHMSYARVVLDGAGGGERGAGARSGGGEGGGEAVGARSAAGPEGGAPAGPDNRGEEPRIRLRMVTRSNTYLNDIERGLKDMERLVPRFDLCLCNAGMDPFEGCSTGGLPGITEEILAERERLVFAWCREHAAATAFVLAGGYIGWGLDADGLVDLHRLTLTAAASSS